MFYKIISLNVFLYSMYCTYNALFFFIFVLVVLGIVDLKKKVYSYSTAINAAAAASSASRLPGPSSQLRKS